MTAASQPFQRLGRLSTFCPEIQLCGDTAVAVSDSVPPRTVLIVSSFRTCNVNLRWSVGTAWFIQDKFVDSTRAGIDLLNTYEHDSIQA